MDEAGTVVFPLEVRKKLHLDQGGELEYETVADRVELRAVEEDEAKNYRIANKGGLLVIESDNPGRSDAAAAIQADHEAEDEEDPPYKVVNGISVILGGQPIPGGVAAAVRRERDAMADRALRRP